MESIGNNTLYLGDCLEVMSHIDDASVDFILCDLPYNVTYCDWDELIDLQMLWKQYRRIIKPNCAIALFAQTPFDKVLGCSNLEWLKYEWIWEKSKASNFLLVKKMPLRAHENILIFGNGSILYNPIKLEGSPYKTRKIDSKHKTPAVFGKINNYNEREQMQMSGRYPRTVIYHPTAHNEGKYHPTQKPVGLLEIMIRTYTNKDAIVLDNCMGSGSTGVACINTDRNFIGIEKDEAFYNTSLDRIRKAYNKQKNKLF